MGTTVFRRKVALLVAGIIAALPPIPVWAAEPAVSLPQALAVARYNNGELASFREEKGIRDASVVQAGILPNPILDLEAQTGALTGSKHDNSFSVGLSQEFQLADKRAKRRSVAEWEQDIYRWQLADKERLLQIEVTTVFYEVLLAQERVALADRLSELNKHLFEVAKERLAAGDIPELELNLARVEVARSEGIRIESAKTLLQEQARLWSLMGLSVDNQPPVTGALAASTVLIKPLAELKLLARANRPDLKVFESEQSRGKAELIRAQADAIPNLTAGLVFSRDTSAMEIGGSEGRDTAYTIGVKLSVPIPVFDRNRAGIQDATAKKNSSDIRVAAAITTVEREIESAYTAFKHTVTLLDIYKTGIIPQLEENLKLTQEAYRLGEVGMLAVIQEQKNFFEVTDGYLTALRDQQTALAKLESVTAAPCTGGDK